jgi:hypothetical protein
VFKIHIPPSNFLILYNFTSQSQGQLLLAALPVFQILPPRPLPEGLYFGGYAPYFYGSILLRASKKSLHKPGPILEIYYLR